MFQNRLSDAFVMRVSQETQPQIVPLSFKEVSFLHTTGGLSPQEVARKRHSWVRLKLHFVMLKRGIRIRMI